MYARIGAPGRMHCDLLAAKAEYRRFDCALYGGSIVLALPAGKGPAIIFDQ